MRHSSLATPLAAVLLLVACSPEEAPDNGMESAESVSVGADESPDDNVGDIPPPPPLPDGNEGGNAVDDGDDDGSDDQVATTIPARFHGEWNQDLSACGSGASETRLRISADRLRFYESAGEVREVEIEGDRVIDVTAAYSGEGQSWINERRLALSSDGDSLTVSGDGASMTRSRCP